MKNLLIATTNPGKLLEIQEILLPLGLNLLLPSALGIGLDVEESGATYAENAALKARAYCQAAGILTLADDSGLEVDALDGAPGVYSARYSPKPGAGDADRRALMLHNLAGRPRPWTARFRCSVALAVPHGEVFYADGVCEGRIIPEERGTNGFGYDPIFFLPEFGMTMAELPPQQKNRISHRGRALQAALPILEHLLPG